MPTLHERIFPYKGSGLVSALGLMSLLMSGFMICHGLDWLPKRFGSAQWSSLIYGVYLLVCSVKILFLSRLPKPRK